MWTCIQPSAVAVLFAATCFLASKQGAADANDGDDRGQDTSRIEQEFAEKVERYNKLLKQERFDEATVLGNEARLLQPENPTAELMVLKAQYAKQEAINRKKISFEEVSSAAPSNHSDDKEAVGDVKVRRQRHLRIADGTLERLVFGCRRTARDARLRLVMELEGKTESVEQGRRLTDGQRRKLQLAGRGDIKRHNDRIEGLRRRFEEVYAVDDDNLDAIANTAAALALEAEAIRRTLRFGLFEDDSLFSKALRQIETAKRPETIDATLPELQKHTNPAQTLINIGVVLYLHSVGPSAWLVEHRWPTEGGGRMLNALYAPLGSLARESEMFDDTLFRYLSRWVDPLGLVTTQFPEREMRIIGTQ